MSFSLPVTELVHRRYSCRTYQETPIAAELRNQLDQYLASNCIGPFGTRCRFKLVAATEEDRSSLKGLGTYGMIKNAPGFIVGAMGNGPKALEDFGYLLERAILFATDLGLGTCWLGGSFSKSSFAKKILPTASETIPAVVAIGYGVDQSRDTDRIRKSAGAMYRLPCESLFFNGGFGTAMTTEAAGLFPDVLEAVRWAPSASNKQPWRIVRTETGWHFYLERTKRYGKGSLMFTLLRLADLQRTDMGIAMCHFELVARQLGISGSWVVEEPPLHADGREYTATWRQ